MVPLIGQPGAIGERSSFEKVNLPTVTAQWDPRRAAGDDKGCRGGRGSNKIGW